MASAAQLGDIEYLKQPEVGKVIAQALAEVYTQRPAKPVKYLAEWLLAYSRMDRSRTQMRLAAEEASRALKKLEQERVLEKARLAEQHNL
jgi:hypothetical protein